MFSFARGIFHPYYTVQLAPAVAALAGAGAVALWELGRRRRSMAWALPAAVAAAAAWAAVLLARTPDYQPWLRSLVVPAGLLAAVALASVTLLAGPAAYAATTIGNGNPGTLAGVRRASGRLGGAGLGAGPGPVVGGSEGSETAERSLVAYLEAHRGSATYLVATFSSRSSAPLIIATGEPVVTIGGFTGSDPAPTLAGFQQLVNRGEVRYVLMDGGMAGGDPGGANGDGQAIELWVAGHGTQLLSGGSWTLYEVPATG